MGKAEIIDYPLENRTFVKGDDLRITLTYHPTTKRVVQTSGSKRFMGDHINATHLMLREQGWEVAVGIQNN